MFPRLKTSKKWTTLPKDFADQVVTVFQQNFPTESKMGSFKAEGRIYPQEIMLRVGYLEKGRLKQCNLEVSVDLGPKDEALKKIHLCVDALGSLFADYFEAVAQGSEDPTEELDIPLVWKQFPFQNEKIWLQYSTANQELEKEANRILGLEEDLLVREADEEDEAVLAEAKQADGDEDDEETDPTAPRMFGKIPKKNKPNMI